jgi:hypothetical protein
MKIKIVLIYLFFCSICYSADINFFETKIENDTLNSAKRGKIKLSLGAGLVTTSKSGNFPVYTGEILKTFNDNMCLAVGLDVYGAINGVGGSTLPYLNFYTLYNPYLTVKKQKMAEFYLGPGLEISTSRVRALILLRADYDITDKFSIGVSLKQPVFYNDSESILTYHIFKINLSHNIY